MSNMSYCRFRNTLTDLRDCQDALWDDVGELSLEEKRAAKRLIEICQEIAESAENGDYFELVED